MLYLSRFNQEVMRYILAKAELSFVPLFRASPHVFVRRDSPLAAKERVRLTDLLPYPRLTYEQETDNSLYFAEELHRMENVPKSIIVSNRATLFNLIIGLNGYTISSGILSSDLNGTEIVAVPLESDEYMEIGYIQPQNAPLSAMSQRYLELLEAYVAAYRGEA